MNNTALTADEYRKAIAIKLFIEGEIAKDEAMRRLGVGSKQLSRKVNRYKQEGELSLVHGLKGKPANHKSEKAEIKKKIIELYKNEYRGWNFSHFRSQLIKHYNINENISLVSRTLKDAGFKSPKAKKPKKENIHPPRPRREKAGELIQMDASDHPWLIGGKKLSLHCGIDDASGTVVGGEFLKTETIEGYRFVLKDIIEHYGIPEALYTDYRTVFARILKNGKTSKDTRFSSMANLLGIKVIPTRSPQAKGRIERLWSTFQDRLVHELARLKIKTIEEANRYLKEVFIPEYNAEFAVPIYPNRSAFKPVSSHFNYNMELALMDKRRISGGCYIQYNGFYYAIADHDQKKTYLGTKEPVEIYKFLDNTIHLKYHGEFYGLKKVCSVKDNGLPSYKDPRDALDNLKAHKPAPNHPWRIYGKTKNTYQTGEKEPPKMSAENGHF